MNGGLCKSRVFAILTCVSAFLLNNEICCCRWIPCLQWFRDKIKSYRWHWGELKHGTPAFPHFHEYFPIPSRASYLFILLNYSIYRHKSATGLICDSQRLGKSDKSVITRCNTIISNYMTQTCSQKWTMVLVMRGVFLRFWPGRMSLSVVQWILISIHCHDVHYYYYDYY